MLSFSGGKEMCQNQRSTFIVKPIASLTFVVPWVVHCLRLFPLLKCLALLNKRKKKKKNEKECYEGMAFQSIALNRLVLQTAWWDK